MENEETTTPEAEVAPAAEPAATEPAQPAAEAPAAEADQAPEGDSHARFAALVEDVFKDDAEKGHDSKVLAASLTREQLETMPPQSRAAIRALAGFLKPRMDALEAEKAAWAEKREAEQRKLDEGVAELRRRNIALQKMVNFESARKAASAPEPRIDPTTPEGLRQLAAHEARKAAATGVLDIFKDVEATRAQAERDAFEDELRGKYPDLRDPTTEQAFLAFLKKENEGVAKGQPWRVDARTGARLFFAERAAAENKRKADDARAADVADRAASQRAMNRATSGGGGRRDEGIPDEVYQSGTVTQYLASLSPAERARVRAFEHRRLAN
ncbi:MAG: hypothetical protein FJ090_19865 [Deltaproteobacteria bacterium]|nr:hypothetical protein [Deltaproteobacteria bacterium]